MNPHFSYTGVNVGNLVLSVYSSGTIGRLVPPEDVVGMIRYIREHAAA